jgi:integrase
MKGNISKRGKHSWRLKFDLGRNPAGQRNIQYHTFRGTRDEAEAKLRELMVSVDRSEYVEPAKTTVAEFLRARVDQWEAAGDISARTAERYRQLVENQIVPHLGNKPIQKLLPLDLEAWHTTLRNSGRVRGAGGVAARTIGHAHRVLSKALGDAAKNDIITRNVAKAEPAPKIAAADVVIVRDVPGLIDKLQGSRLRVPAMLALFTGMRLGEVLALRWNCADLDRKVVLVREALEQTKAHGIRFKAPKSKAGRRDITLPDIVVGILREHRKATLELRMQLGAGRLPDDAPLFATIDGKPLSPIAVSGDWRRFAESIDMPEITFHALRHTHASQLIDAGVDVVTVSRRLGHANPNITLAVYAHLFQKDDGKAATAINAILNR